MKKCVIVIPIHSKDPSPNELISFAQCFKVLSKHPIKIIAPKGLDVSKYRKVVSNFDSIFIHPNWFASLKQYNKLKISRYFYSLFSEYEFLLTYELDVFVFSDQLLFWCDQGYDYIGAPWFEDFAEDGMDKSLIGVGNSGFSLRRISSINKVLKKMFYWPEINQPLSFTERITQKLHQPVHQLLNSGKENFTIQKYCSLPEDLFYYYNAKQICPEFRIAPIEKAISFSFEVSPQILFQLNKSELPFGCHAWWKYDLNFWKPYICSYGYDLI